MLHLVLPLTITDQTNIDAYKPSVSIGFDTSGLRFISQFDKYAVFNIFNFTDIPGIPDGTDVSDLTRLLGVSVIMSTVLQAAHDCIAYVSFQIFFTFPAYSFFSSFYGSSLFSPSAFTTFIYFTAYYYDNLQMFGNCFLTLNRFTSIVFPLNHKAIWKFCFPISIVVTALSSLAPCWYLLTTSSWYALISDSENSGYAFTTDNDKYPNFSNSYNSAISSLVTCIICLVLNAISAVFLVYHTSHMTNSTFNSRKVEMNLFFVAALIFLIQCVQGVSQVLIHFAMEAGDIDRVLFIYMLVPWINDFKCLSPAWVLFIVSSSVREAVLRTVPWRLIFAKTTSFASPLFTRV
uniref:Serpentine receptor class gamma n=1 Tax=Steinernema glaseri TaxID=37863 RepID=A0A1I7YUG2_9BILA